jgi:hypothetical protein
MEENNQNTDAEEFLKNLPLQSEEIGFKTDEMVACGKCARRNPPNRLKCMYCGAALELSTAQTARIAPVLRKLENWESGFNLIYRPDDEPVSRERSAEIAKLVGVENEKLQKILDARIPLPVVRAESLKEAEILQDRLRDLGLKTTVVSDERLAAEIPPQRLRALEFRDDYILLTLFNTGETEIVKVDELSLIISGALFQKSIASTEARKKGQTKILDATETASDEMLIDLYTKNEANGFRILTKGFDFSCLGAQKSLLARENIKTLIVKLQSLAPAAKLVDDYLAVRGLLGEIWEVEQRKDSQGLTRQRFGKFDLSNVSTSNNLQQFTKYSRLQWHIL